MAVNPAEARLELAARLEATGLRVVLDPRAVQPPCVVVGMPSPLTARALDWCNVTTTIPVTLVAVPPASGAALEWLLDNVVPVMVAVGSLTAQEGTYPFGDGELPAYVAAVDVALSP